MNQCGSWSLFREQELTALKFVVELESICREQESIGENQKYCIAHVKI